MLVKVVPFVTVKIMYSIGSRETVAAFDVDAQKCFTPLSPDELPVPDGNNIVHELNRQAELATVRIGSKDAHPANSVWVATDDKPQLSPVIGHKNVDLHWNRHAVPGTAGFELVDGLPNVTEYDFFVWKGVETDIHPYGACFHDLEERLSTGVIEFLRGRGISTIVIGGLALDHCVKTTALQLCNAGFRVFVNLAASRGLSNDTVVNALEEMKLAGVVIVSSVDELYFEDVISDASSF